MLIGLAIWGVVFLTRLGMFPFRLPLDAATFTLAGIAVLGLLLVVLLVFHSQLHKAEERELRRLQRTYVEPEEEVGRTASGGEVEGEELVEVEPDYVDSKPQRAATPPQAVAAAAGAVQRVAAPAASPAEAGSQRVVDWPPAVKDGAIYADAVVRISAGILLKVRTMVGTYQEEGGAASAAA